MVSSWNTPDMEPDHAAGACTEFTGHVPAQAALSAFLHPNTHSQCEAKGERPSKPPQSAFPPKLPWHHHTHSPYLPSHGRGSRITFFINQFTPSLNTSPPKKEICEGKTAVSSPLRDPSTYQALSVDKNPKHYVSNFLFWLLGLKRMASKFYTWGKKAFIFSSLSIWQHIVYTCSFSAADTQKDKNYTE